LDRYIPLLGAEIDGLRALARPLERREVLMVNSTRTGGGVAELLSSIIPMLQELGMVPRWEIVQGDQSFFEVTKAFHNALHGGAFDASSNAFDIFRAFTESNRNRLNLDADFAVMHDPQPAGLIDGRRGKAGHWVWRCHIDLSRPHPPCGSFSSRGSRATTRRFSHRPNSRAGCPFRSTSFIPRSIRSRTRIVNWNPSFIRSVLERFQIDPARPIITQISRFDRLKDPVGVVRAYRIVKRYFDCQLVLAGGGADDDPEGDGRGSGNLPGSRGRSRHSRARAAPQ
jgi:trehalose synthase